MRICLVNVSEWIEGFHDLWFGMMMSSFRKVLRSDTKVEIRSVKPVLKGDNALDFDNVYYDLLNKRQVADVIVKAEREGFDAVVVGCFGDTGVREARGVVEIPVIGAGETSVLFACQLGRRFGVIATNMPEQIAAIEDKITLMGLKDRLVPRGVRFDIHPFAETWEKGLQDAKFVADGVAQRARELVADGADVVLVGCCGIGPFCSLAGLSEIEAGGRRIPIIDPMMISMKTAEMCVDLKKGTGLPFTSMAIPPRADVDRVRASFGLLA